MTPAGRGQDGPGTKYTTGAGSPSIRDARELSAVAGVAAKQKGESFAVTKAYGLYDDDES